MNGANGAIEATHWASEGDESTSAFLEVEELFAPLPPVRWLCMELDIAPGAPTLIAGYGFSGKTVAVQDFALAVATGSLAWGRFLVRHGRVLHLDYEQGAYLTRARYQRLARARGIEPADIEGRLTVAPLPSLYLDGDARGDLERICDGFDLVIVDSFRAACPRTEENSSEARIPLDRTGRISEATGATFLWLHHARKPSQERTGGARASIRGSGALFDAAASVLVFCGEKGEPVTVEHEKARITGRTHPDFRLHIEDVEIDGSPTAGLRLTATEGPGEATEGSARFAALKTRVLELARQEGTLGGVNAIRERLGARKEAVSAAVTELEAAGLLKRGGTYQRPTFSLGTDDHER